MGSLVKEYRVFPSGATFKPTETVNNVANGTTVAVSDNGPYFETPPSDDLDYCVHSHLFWNVAGTVSTSSSVNVTVQGTTVVTGWYRYGCSPGGPGTAITTYAFDVDANAEMGTTPIGSVTPSGLWTAPSNSVTPNDSGTVTIDAKNSISGKDFTKWLIVGAGSPSGDDVIIPAGAGGLYVAFYEAPDGPGFEFGRFDELIEILKPGLDIDWVVDPSPLDRFRLALIMTKMAQAGGPAGVTDDASAAGARKELSRLRAEIKRLEATAQALESRLRGQ